MGAYQSGQADLAVAVGSNPLSGAVGSSFTVTAAVSNTSVNDAPSTVLTLKLPTGLIYSSYSSPQGTCSGVGTITCALGDLPAGGGSNVTVVATGETAGPQTVTASVASGVPDPNTANDSASITVTVGTTTPDAGTTPADAGQAADAGGTEDAGATHDAGVTEDAGSQPDAGVVADAGAQPDAGTVGDGGPGTEPRGGCGCGAGSSAAAVHLGPAAPPRPLRAAPPAAGGLKTACAVASGSQSGNRVGGARHSSRAARARPCGVHRSGR